MKVAELRSGNWITFLDYPIKVGPKEIVGLSQIEAGGIHSDEMEPIPLTPEILEMAGFEVPDGYNDTVLYKDGIMIDFHLGEYKLRENNRIKLKYLHQLQNLYFALTGEELEIKL